MKDLIKIEPIAVKDKNDVVKALTLLERIGIKRMSESQKTNYLEDDNKQVDNYFMVQEDDGGFRIQSHYIGFGISLESLEKQIDTIIVKHPDICNIIEDIQKKKEMLSLEIKEMEETFAREINDKKESINGLQNDVSIIEIKQRP